MSLRKSVSYVLAHTPPRPSPPSEGGEGGRWLVHGLNSRPIFWRSGLSMNRRLQTGGHLTPARAQLSLRRGFARSPLGGRRGRALIGSWSQLTSEIGGVSMNRTLTRPGGHPLPSDGRGAGGEGPSQRKFTASIRVPKQVETTDKLSL